MITATQGEAHKARRRRESAKGGGFSSDARRTADVVGEARRAARWTLGASLRPHGRGHHDREPGFHLVLRPGLGADRRRRSGPSHHRDAQQVENAPVQPAVLERRHWRAGHRRHPADDREDPLRPGQEGRHDQHFGVRRGQAPDRSRRPRGGARHRLAARQDRRPAPGARNINVSQRERRGRAERRGERRRLGGARGRRGQGPLAEARRSSTP